MRKNSLKLLRLRNKTYRFTSFAVKHDIHHRSNTNDSELLVQINTYVPLYLRENDLQPVVEIIFTTDTERLIFFDDGMIFKSLMMTRVFLGTNVVT